jgi:hypothetical protein
MQYKTMYTTSERVMLCGMTSAVVCMLLWWHMQIMQQCVTTLLSFIRHSCTAAAALRSASETHGCQMPAHVQTCSVHMGSDAASSPVPHDSKLGV